MPITKTLYLIRHAKSSWDDSSLSDFQRSLNDRGLKDSPLMAKLIKGKNIIPDLIISSPAVRAISTAEIFANEFHYNKNKIINDERIYEAAMRDLITTIRKINDEYNIVMLFGHNPGLSNTANLLGNKFLPELPTCAVVGIELKVNSWSEVERNCGEIILLEYPKKSLK
ncbi:MAG: histidine phosphatase family protein [Ignavibacteriales bacterium]|nr:histidine phosphatase family protein [Ignavibacteriales bacterium]